MSRSQEIYNVFSSRGPLPLLSIGIALSTWTLVSAMYAFLRYTYGETRTWLWDVQRQKQQNDT